jgi:hypothetical protein
LKAFINYLVDHPGKEFSAQEMAKVLGVTQPQFRGVVGAFGHRVHSRYGWKKWPIEWRWDGQESTAVYRMSSAVARVIKAAR